MDSEKVLEVIERYRKFFRGVNIHPDEFPDVDELKVVLHCYAMLDKMEGFISEGRMEKTFRWLGFIQGCLWSLGIYSLEDLKNHNKPKEN